MLTFYINDISGFSENGGKEYNAQYSLWAIFGYFKLILLHYLVQKRSIVSLVMKDVFNILTVFSVI
jgi:hypothetical protein